MKMDFKSPTFKLLLTLHRLNIDVGLYASQAIFTYLSWEEHERHVKEHIAITRSTLMAKYNKLIL